MFLRERSKDEHVSGSVKYPVGKKYKSENLRQIFLAFWQVSLKAVRKVFGEKKRAQKVREEVDFVNLR